MPYNNNIMNITQRRQNSQYANVNETQVARAFVIVCLDLLDLLVRFCAQYFNQHLLIRSRSLIKQQFPSYADIYCYNTQ